MIDILTKLVNKMSPGARTLLIVLLLMAFSSLAWQQIDPAPMRVDIKALDARVTGLERELDSTQQGLGAMRRWMCYQNWDDAMKSGIPCHVIIGPRP